jgi:hypothetical protein
MAGGKRPGAGRKRGVPNKTTTALKEAILNAFAAAGGEDYLLTLAQTDPKTFAMLLGRVLPLSVAGDKDNPVQVNVGVSWMTKEQAQARGWV